MSVKNFKEYSRYYDLLYVDKDYSGEADYIHSTLSRNGVSSGDLLEFGSGTGKHGLLLANKGYHVHGIEQSADMVAEAEVGYGFTCEEGNVAETSMGRCFDAVISLFHVMSYQTQTNQLRAVMDNAAKHLIPGGLFVFDFWYSPAVFTEKPVVRVKRMANDQISITRIAEPICFPNANCVNVEYTIYIHDLKNDNIQTFHETHPMRHFSLPEIELLASLHGFDLIEAEEFITGNTPSDGTWSVGVVLKKRKK